MIRVTFFLVASIVSLACGRQPQNLISSVAINQSIDHSASYTSFPSSTVSSVDSHYSLPGQSLFAIKSFDHATDHVSALIFDTSKQDSVTTDKQAYCLMTGVEFEIYSDQDSESLYLQHDQSIEDRLRVISFARRVDDITVDGAYYSCRFVKKSGQWFLHSIRNELRFEFAIDSKNSALALQSSLGGLFAPDVILEAEEPIYVLKDGVLVLMKKIDTAHAGHLSTVIVDPRDGKLVRSKSRRLGITKHLTAEAFKRSYLDEDQFRTTLPLTAIHSQNGINFTNHDGAFFEREAINSISLDSSRVSLFKGDEQIPIRLFNFSDQNQRLSIAESGNQKLAINAYSAIHRINRFTREFLSEEEVPYLDRNVQVRINQAGSCNAFYTTVQAVITLFNAGDGCANIAGVNDVIYHEWGHGLDDHTGREQGVSDNAFSEGISDFLSAFYNDDPLIGVGFVQGSHSGIRTVSNDLRYPEDRGNPHVEGGIIAGALWDTYQALIRRHGETLGKNIMGRLFFKHLLVTDYYLDSYEALLLIDDNDQNSATRSPNHCLINEAFFAHGLASELDCVDEIVNLPESDYDLTVALITTSGGGLGLVASYDKSHPLFLCFSSRQRCLSSSALHKPLVYLNRNEQRTFYHYQGELPTNRLGRITLIAKNSDGIVESSRAVKIVSK